MIINLPGGKRLIVDAKVPLNAYLEAQETADETLRDRKLAEHTRQVKDHITRLSQKSYCGAVRRVAGVRRPVHPRRVVFSAAVQRDPELLEYGFSRGVVPASPTNLVALLKTVHYAWRQEKAAANAEQIRDIGVELYERLATMTGHFKDLGASLTGR